MKTRKRIISRIRYQRSDRKRRRNQRSHHLEGNGLHPVCRKGRSGKNGRVKRSLSRYQRLDQCRHSRRNGKVQEDSASVSVRWTIPQIQPVVESTAVETETKEKRGRDNGGMEYFDVFRPHDSTWKTGAIEALLFAANEPLSYEVLMEAIPELGRGEIPALIDRIETKYTMGGHGITVQKVAGGYRLATRAEYSEPIKRHHRGRIKNRLTRAALETVSIIAYKQPVSRAEVEAIRGVECSQVIRNLVERGLVKIYGRAEVPGRPLLYSTTDAFLQYFGLDDLKSLPNPNELLGEDADTGNGIEVQPYRDFSP